MRVTIAFKCTNCGWYNYPQLRDNMSGNYTICCGNCRHHHYRAVRSGCVTEERHSPGYGRPEVIHVMPSACSREPRKRSPLAKLRSLFVENRPDVNVNDVA